MVLELIIAATVIVSLISVIGILFFSKKITQNSLFLVISFATGTLLAASILHLLPESMEEISIETAVTCFLIGILFSFAIEKIVLWHHHHSTKHSKREKPLLYLNLIGDAFHNFFDGVAIAAAFLAGIPIGIATTAAVIFHEIPQEIGDYFLLIYAGLSKKKALAFNFLSALTAVLGGISFYYAAEYVSGLVPLGLAFTAGTFVYIATADLVPELHKEENSIKSAKQLLMIILGILVIVGLSKLVAE
ncbi:MAG: ZIP family metal transporter [Candidatus Micrarchaeota archaeon]